MSRNRRSRFVVSFATVVAGALVATVADAPFAYAYRRKAPATQVEPSVDGYVAGVESAPTADATATAAARETAHTAWPGAGSAKVAVPVKGRARAGALPVHVRAAGASRPTVTVEVLGQDESRRRGINGVALRVRRADGGTTAAPVTVEVDYSSFANAIGGNWATRLRLVSLPSGDAVPTRNTFSRRTLTATVDAAPATSDSSAGTFAVAASSGGGAGDYGATSLAPSAQWQVNAQTGDFSWMYPFRVPPGVNGPTPALKLGYSSGSVDGRVASTNAQPSWIGEGHSLEEGYVERKYVSCADDQTGGNNATTKTGDLCWRTDNANVVLSGHSGELVKDAVTGEWHLENDDASKMERLTGGGNGALNGEYWRLTTSDGTQYWFGLAKRYATDTINTNSTWTVPVYGNQPGEPCYQTTYASSSCTQAWRWNLSYVVDPHGNTMTYHYTPETNYYGRNNGATTTAYHRGGWLNKIEYGERKGSEATTTAPAQVDFTVKERCLTATTATFNCETTAPTTANASNWPDVPVDQLCAATANPCANRSPSFFTRKRLTQLQSKYLNGATTAAVDTWTFNHSFPDPGDGTSKSLWLTSLQHTGNVGTAIALPSVTFAGVQMQNRVDGIDIAPPLIKYRVSSITSETGAVTSVNYAPQECSTSNLPAAPETNAKRCFPVFYTPEGQTEPTRHWFHKYVVANVVDDDRTGSSQDKLTTYTYLDTPAWHFDDNELSPPKYRTYGDYRGYGKVRVTLGQAGSTQSVTESLYLRGMDEDPLPGGGVRDVKVTDSTGGVIDDHPRLSGTLRETRTFNGGQEVDAAIYDPYVSAPTAVNGAMKAYVTGLARTRARTTLEGGGVRRTETATTFDEYGLESVVEDLGDVDDPADDICTRTTYARNTAAWIIDAIARVEVVSVKCATPPSRPAHVLSDTRTYFDGSTTLGAAPTQGLPTKTEVLDSWPGTGAVYKQKNRFAYDAHGRTTESYDALDRKTTFAYTPATGGPVTQMVEKNPLGHAKTTTLHPAWGVATVELDANSKRTEVAYDALGRVTQVWTPTRLRSSFATSPSMRFSYLVRNNGPVVVTTEELRNDGTYTPTYALYDGLLRPRQSQAPAPGGGRVIEDTAYDSRGLVLDQNGPYYNSSAPGTSLLVAADSAIPAQTRFSYDGASRETVAAFRVNGVEKWRTTTTYGGDRVHVDPPAGDTATTTIMDARGRVVSRREYRGGAPTGAFEETTYEYYPDDQLKAVHDPAGNTWTYTYDLRGRLTATTDPDKGASSLTYDALDQPATVTDARGKTVAYTYDVLGRKTEQRETSATGPLLATWTYDPAGAVGMLASSTRYVGANAYTTEITAFDAAGRPTSSRVRIPASEGALAGDYTTTLTYNVDGGVKTIAQPAVTGLPNETLSLGYDSLGNADTLAGFGSYVSDTIYSPYGETLQMELGNTVGKTSWQTFFYEEGTRRLERSMVDRMNVAVSDADVRYTYDHAGNVAKISDQPVNGPAPDTQCFTYDHLRRMTEAWTATNDCATSPSLSIVGGPAPYWRTWTYDVTGNRLSETDHGTGGDTTRAYTYPAHGSARPHAVSSVTTTRPDGTTSTDTFGYDAVGNVDARSVGGVAETLAWNGEGRLESVSGAAGTTSFLYDANGDRLIRRDPQAVTLYLDNTEVRLDLASNTVSGTRYYSHNGMTIAVRKGAEVETLASDHHGTANVSIDNDTTAVTKRRFDPFGNARGAAATGWIGERSFVGGTADPTTRLVHLGAREYDPVHGRFVSVDPVIDVHNPQQMNGYAYADNNPVSFSDPDGLMVAGDGGGGGGGGGGSNAGATQTPQPKPYKYRNRAQEDLHSTERPLTAQDYARIEVDVARERRDQAKREIKESVGEILKIAADELGITAAVSCFTEGDAGSCGEMAVNIAMSFVGGIAGKLLKKYGMPWKWKQGFKLVSKLWKLAGKVFDGVKSFLSLTTKLGRLERRLQHHVDDVVQAFDSGAIQMTHRQAAAAAKNPRLAKAFRGERIDTEVKKRIEADPKLNSKVTVTGRFKKGPDVLVNGKKRWFDITTDADWDRHEKYYTPDYGKGRCLCY